MKFSKEIKESLTLKFAQIARDLKAQGENIISMTIGEPDFNTPKYVVDATINAINDGYTRYSNSQGLSELRKLISLDLNNNYKTNYKKEDIIITPGVKSGLHLALSAILKPNDEVIILSPYYLSYPPLVKIAEPNAEIIDVPLNIDGRINKKLLKDAFNNKTKAILVNTPSNPTGQLLNNEEVKLIKKLSKKYNSYIVSDEIYDKLVYEKDSFVSFLEKDSNDKLIYANGFSKSYSMTGYRIGYVAANKEVITKMLLLQQNINTNVNTFVQKGACSVYLNEENHLDSYLEELQEKVNKFTKFLNNSKLFKGIKPEAGFFYFVNIDNTNLTSEELTETLIKEAKIVVTPGIGFGESYNNYIRFSLSIRNEELDQAIENLKAFEKSFLKTNKINI